MNAIRKALSAAHSQILESYALSLLYASLDRAAGCSANVHTIGAYRALILRNTWFCQLSFLFHMPPSSHTHTRISVIPIKLARRYVCLFRFRFQWFITHIFLCARVCARKAYTYTLNICKQYA